MMNLLSWFIVSFTTKTVFSDIGRLFPGTPHPRACFPSSVSDSPPIFYAVENRRITSHVSRKSDIHGL